MSIGGAIVVAVLIWAAFQPITARGLFRAFVFLAVAFAAFVFFTSSI